MMAHDDEILTAYLDGELEPQERREVEARLAAQPELREQLEVLRAASKAVHDLPRKKAPASILAAVRGEIARGAEGNGQVIRAGERFKPAARPSRWRNGLISVAAMLAVGVMIFVAVKPTLLQGPKEQMSADTQAPAAVEAPQAAQETRSLVKAEKRAETKADALEGGEEAEHLERNVQADAGMPAAEPPAEGSPPANKAFEFGNAKQALAKKDRAQDAYRGEAQEKAKGLAAPEAAGADKTIDVARGNATPAEPGAPDALDALKLKETSTAGGAKPVQSLDEKNVATRASNATEIRDGANAPVTETAAARPKEPLAAAKPAAPPAPAAPAAQPDQKAAKAGVTAGPKSAKAAEYAAAPEEQDKPDVAGVEDDEKERLALAHAPDAKPAGEKSNREIEFKKALAAKEEATAAAADVPAKAAPPAAPAASAAPTVIRVRTEDLDRARAELLALATAQGGSELAQARPSGDAERRRGLAGPASKEDAKSAGERLVADALKKSEEQLRAPADQPAHGEGKTGEGQEQLGPLADADVEKRTKAEPDAAANLKRKDPERKARESKDQVALDPTSQPKVMRLVLQVPASKKAALLAALQKQANRHTAGRLGNSIGEGAPGGQGGKGGGALTLGGADREVEAGKAPEQAEQEQSKKTTAEQPGDAGEKIERLEGTRQAVRESHATEVPLATEEPLEVIEVLIELAP